MKVKVLKNETDYEAATLRIYELIQKGVKPESTEDQELQLLALTVEDYERKHYPVPPPDPIEAIKFRLEQMGMSENQLNKILGGRQRKYDILHKKRKLSIQMIRRLHEVLNIPAEVLIQDYDLETERSTIA